MRWQFIFILCCLVGAPRAMGLEFPYEAYVNSDDVYVRSGPARDYYPTDKLDRGAKIEVYRHDPGGWLAIRPPEGSYSWVSRRHLDLEAEDLATVNTDRVVARVGSTFSDVRDVIQVRLDRDERVALLERPAEDSPWCKIAPPSGEFRWIFAKYVERKLPGDLAADEREARDSDVYREAPGGDVRLTGGEERTDTAVDPQVWAESVEDLERLRQLERLDMELSEVVAGDITQWTFEGLHEQAEFALRAAQDSLERGRARLLLDKIARFEDIKRRHDALENRPQEAQPARAPSLPPELLTDKRYDGVGRLSPVVSQQTGGPQYALLDASGEVLSFVTPAPGVNLRPYVDKYIGVSGQRGYLPDQRRQHVSVQRVSLLDVERR
ncbi:MAG: SH3 domain-containing protein [Planctomycetota bacterium]|nr:MAG: SH3 domain-containing protein [Planctomycetota bacterium]